jgi:hypothetical protein
LGKKTTKDVNDGLNSGFLFTFVIMKRLIAIFLLCFYLIPSIGFSVNLHWCCNKISSVSFWGIQPNTCKSCKTQKTKTSCGKNQIKKGCCKNIQIAVKITDNQKGTPSTTVKDNSIKRIDHSALILPFNLFSPKETFDFSNYHAPPQIGKLPVYLTICVLKV